MEREKKQYITPGLTIVTFRTERGNALSGIGLAETFNLLDGADSQEAWQSDNTYSNYS